MMAETRFLAVVASGKSDHWLSKLLQHGMGSLDRARAKSPGFSTAKGK